MKIKANNLQAFTLVEMILAIGVAAIVLIAVNGVLFAALHLRDATSEVALDFNWTLTTQAWPEDSAMQVVTAEVKFTAQGKDYSVKLETLATQPGVTTMNLTK